jgi:hypothetical protein
MDRSESGCSEAFAQLCALSTSGCLSANDEALLAAHVAVCPACSVLLHQYRVVATSGMAKVAAIWTHHDHPVEAIPNAERLKYEVCTAALNRLPVRQTLRGDWEQRLELFFAALKARRFAAFAAVASALVIVMAGQYVEKAQSFRRANVQLLQSAGAEAALRSQLADAKSSLTLAREQLADALRNADALQVKSLSEEQEIKELRQTEAALDAKFKAAADESQRQRASIEAVSAERDTLAQRLHDSESSLQSVRQELKAAQDTSKRVQFRIASLELQIDRLSQQTHEHEALAQRNQQYLDANRDIRELMGARQLHIADVFDVDPQGRNRAPFGRVFFTKGKSLIFYGFDLDQQPGYRETKAFQAWGRLQSGQPAPVNLGVFYLDNETNRRWALTFANPKVLDEINAVFVTVEPKGGSKQPTNKPFLVTYLRTSSLNHP